MSTKLLGYDDASGGIVETADYFLLTQVTAVASGNMTIFRVKTAVEGNVKCALYEDIGGYPRNLITAMNTGQAVVVGYNDLNFTSTPITASTVYWLAINIDTVGAVVEGLGGSILYAAASYAGFTFPSPYNASLSFDSLNACERVSGWGASGWAHIGKINGVSSSAIGKINGVLVAAIGKINGVPV
jgi:hypothetical protein